MGRLTASRVGGSMVDVSLLRYSAYGRLSGSVGEDLDFTPTQTWLLQDENSFPLPTRTGSTYKQQWNRAPAQLHQTPFS